MIHFLSLSLSASQSLSTGGFYWILVAQLVQPVISGEAFLDFSEHLQVASIIKFQCSYPDLAHKLQKLGQ